jgi:DNA polymerase-1
MFNSKGINTSTIFGFLLSLEDILRNQKPTHIAAAFDTAKPTFRHKLYKKYKENRLVTPEEIRNSIPVIKKLLELMNIEILESPGYEADDIIGTIAKKAVKNNFKVYMVTSDKDYCQLVEDNIFIFKPKKSGNESEIMGIEEVKKKYGVEFPEQIIDLLALWGDASDNIPGVPGIGEKTASKLIAEYKTIDNLIQNIDKLSSKQNSAIKQNLNDLLLSKQLVTINTSVPIEYMVDKLKLSDFKETELKELLLDLNLRTLVTKFIKSTNIEGYKPVGQYIQASLFEQEKHKNEPNTSSEYHTINSVNHIYHKLEEESQIIELAKILEKEKQFCFDTETTGLDTLNDFLVGVSICFKKNEAYYIPLPDNFEQARQRLDLLKEIFEDRKIIKIGHNLKFDILFFCKYNIKVTGELFDTMIAHYLIQPEQSHKMDFLAEKYMNYSPVPIEELIGMKGSSQINMKNVPLEKIGEYAAEDADVTFQLKEIFQKELEKNDLKDLFYNIESKLLKVLIDIELNGFKIDLEYLNYYSILLNKEIEKVEKEIYLEANEKFNINSPKQLGEILFEKLKISENAKKTKTKQYSTNEDVLQGLTNKHPIINKILDYRSLTKLLSTYVDALPKLVNSKTGKVHTTFNQTLAVTGRLSSNNPNLQNIPIREARGREIRNAFIPSTSNNILLSADYSQIELRIMAHISEDENMIEAFKEKEDIHSSTAAKVFKIPINEVNKEQRSKAKTANFGIIYGISSFGLAQRMNISKKEASELIEEYFKTFPGVRRYMSDTINFARENKYVQTIFKRKRFLPDINSQNSFVRGMAERNAINTPIQGSAADIIKIAMVNIFDSFNELGLKSKMILQVHDELVFDVLKTELEEVKQIVKSKMENPVKLKVPLIVDIGIGNNWLEAH